MSEANARQAAHAAGQDLTVFEAAVRATDGVQAAVLAADLVNDQDTVVAVPGFTAYLEPGSYLFDYTVFISSAATTTGVRFEPTFSGTGTRKYTYLGSGVAASTLFGNAPVATGLVGPDNLPAASAQVSGKVYGSVIVTVAGTLALTFASEVDESAATLRAGSTQFVKLV